MHWKKSILFVFLLCGLSCIVEAQESVVCKVEINPDSILMDNYFIVSFTLENAGGNFEEPLFNDFEVVSGPNKSSSVSIINGVTSKKASYSYYLKPKAPGNFYIDPVQFILDDDKIIQTEPLELMVYPNPEGRIIEPRSQNSMPNMSFDWFFGGEEFDRTSPRQQYPEQKIKKKERKKFKF